MSSVIFDCDGVLVNSEEMSCKALNIVFEEKFDVDIGTDYSAVLGTSLSHSFLYFMKKHDLEYANIGELLTLKDQIYISLARERLETFPDCERFIQKLKQMNIDLSVASSGSLEKINFSLETVHLSHYFQQISSAIEVEEGKPAPDLFLLAADKLKTAPHSCLVIEDSINGIIAARNAGMKVIAFPGSFPQDVLKKSPADYVTTGYSDLIEVFQGSLDYG